MNHVATFDDIRDDFRSRVEHIVWCNVTTVDGRDRPRSRILHPLWEGSTGWILSSRHSAKEKHLAHNPYVSLCYFDLQQQQQVYAECRAEWIDGDAEKRRLWDLFESTPEPVGYNPALFWAGGPGDSTFGVLKLSPWRIEIGGLAELMSGSARIWEPKS